MTNERAEKTTDLIIDFLKDIGIPVTFEKLPDPGFLPGIFVQEGGLIINRDELLFPGDILHEAGHLAVMPPQTRMQANGNVGDDGGEEMAALAWSYAAACAIGLSPDIVFHEFGYKGNGPWLSKHFQNGGTIGVPLLAVFEMTSPHIPRLQQPDTPIDEAAAFPNMLQWLRTIPDLSEETSLPTQRAQ
ncbi:hypothetical protein [Thalassospira marina]|uniref:IrrE N-terminal-like domain-containing protein n=1 Tax=Thalassospira marina TaxID=2048283 RepID=A0ABN5FH42_9PROT|nr:hypothetical protein [Thalassospira marina]AUG54031.1 hypothetical protein CSC3H3_15850 [Thalassospira marina]